MITHEQLMEISENVMTAAQKLLRSKNQDYSGGKDALFNIRRGGQLGVAVRLDDKVSRLLSLLRAGKDPNHEAIDDTILDLINYAVLLQALRTEDLLEARAASTIADPLSPAKPYRREDFEKGTGK